MLKSSQNVKDAEEGERNNLLNAFLSRTINSEFNV